MTPIFLLLACHGKNEPVDSVPPDDEPEIRSVGSGPAGWDPVWLDTTDGTLEPVLSDTEGTEQALVELSQNSQTYAWAPATTLPPGTYTMTSSLFPELEASYEVLPYGQAENFDATLLVGSVWALPEPPAIVVPLDQVLWGGVQNPRVQVLSVEASSSPGDDAVVHFRIFVDDSTTGAACIFMEEDGTVDAAGSFHWAQDSVDVPLSDESWWAPLHATDMQLHWGWLGDVTGGGGVEGGVTIDTRALDPLLAEDPDSADSLPARDTAAAVSATCELLTSFGAECSACVDGEHAGEPYCATIRFHGGVLVPSAEVLPEEADTCGVDLETGAATCEVGDISCAGAMLPIWGLAAWLRRGRRRTGR